MDAKDTWPVVKFIIAATGFKRRDARRLLGEIPQEHYSQLFLRARSWDRDAAHKAGAELASLLGGETTLQTLLTATQMAQLPSPEQEDDTDENGDDEVPQRRRAARKTTGRK